MQKVEKLIVNLNERSYPIYITTDFSNIGYCFEECSINTERKLVVISDKNVDNYYGDALVKNIRNAGYNIEKCIIAPGENSKNILTAKYIYSHLIELKLDRKAVLIALGGGVVGDITGFAASTYLRGIDFIQIPTTLLSQVDSSVGGKTGIDFNGIKNVIGTFYQPKLVFINVKTLKTLPISELKSGMAEVIKHSIIKDKELFYFLKNNLDNIYTCNEDVLKHVVKTNCMIKSSIVEKDEKEESGIRAVLNFGHTIGHALESASEYKLSHGECVSIGIIGAFKIAGYMGMVTNEETTDVINLLEKAGLPTEVKGIDPKKVYEKIFYDKKVNNGRILFILPREIGKVEKRFVNDEELVMKVLSEILI